MGKLAGGLFPGGNQGGGFKASRSGGATGAERPGSEVGKTVIRIEGMPEGTALGGNGRSAATGPKKKSSPAQLRYVEHIFSSNTAVDARAYASGLRRRKMEEDETRRLDKVLKQDSTGFIAAILIVGLIVGVALFSKPDEPPHKPQAPAISAPPPPPRHSTGRH